MFARLLFLLVAVTGLTGSLPARAQTGSENAEARVYFEEGNRLYGQATQAGAEERTALLQRSLEAYVDSLRIVRSRNALFNAAIVLEELGRNDEAFNYWTEYLTIEGVPETDAAEAKRRQDALRQRVAVLRVTTEPAGARVWLDRKDLAPRGETPIELALPAGAHTLFVEREGYAPVELPREALTGQTVAVEVTLLPVAPTIEEPEPLAEPVPEPREKLRNAAIGTAASTLATAGVAIGLSVRARSLRDESNQAGADYSESGDPADLQRAEDLADRTDRFNIAADVMWGTTIALGISAITLYAVHKRRKNRERPDVAIAISRRGAFASVGMRFGGGR